MSVVVGFASGAAAADALGLGVTLANARGTTLVVATVVPPRWSVPSMARVDAEFEEWATAQGRAAEQTVAASLSALPEVAGVEFRAVAARSVAAALIRVADEADAEIVVVGSSEGGRPGRIALGSTSDRLVHSSRIPVALAPRGYAVPPKGLARVTCAVAGQDGDAALVTRAKEAADRAGVALRLVTFAVRLDTMYPAEVGYDAEDAVAAAVGEQAGECIATLRAEGVVGPQVEAVVGLGAGWQGAMDAVEWDAGDLLVVGTNPRGSLARVFLGSSATKIIRHSPVPVILAPEP